MNLLLDEVDVLETAGDPSTVDVLGVEHDSRLVTAGDLFCCLTGGAVDGHRFAAEAVRRGAVAVLCEHLVPEVPRGPVVQARVGAGQARPAMAIAASTLYGFPASELTMAAVTGTNGKTTVTHLVGAILDHAGVPTTVVGTLSGIRTTPEANELQRLLAGVRDRQRAEGRRHAVALEVSSHALVQARVDCVRFDVAAFTNLTHEHLDYHGTMEAYFEAKASLFTPARAALGVVNADDPWGQRLLASPSVPLVAVSRRAVSDVLLAVGTTSFTWRGRRVGTRLSGSVNVENALMAAEIAVALGIEPAEAAAGLGTAEPVPGRLEVVAAPGTGGPAVIVDYAHTPRGLQALLEEAARLASGAQVLVVFGCGGNRDRAKRPRMGRLAAEMADRAYVTSDNPRDEDPDVIIAEVLEGAGASARDAGRLVVEPDRRAAISLALHAARPGDVVVVAGKGHENYQEVEGRLLPFDDRVVVANLLGTGGGGAEPCSR